MVITSNGHLIQSCTQMKLCYTFSDVMGFSLELVNIEVGHDSSIPVVVSLTVIGVFS